MEKTMTRKEAVALLERYSNYDGMGMPNLAGCKEAIKVAVDALKEAFPELAESEDERVRKWIYNVIESLGMPADEDAEKELEEMQPRALAYLEKQKEFVSHNFEDIWTLEGCEDIVEIGDELTPRFKELLKEVCHAWYDKGTYLEKQKGPKPGTTEDNPIDPFDTKLFQDGVKEGRRLEREDMRKPFSCGYENGDSEKPNNQWSDEEKTAIEIKDFILYKAGHLVDEETEHRFIKYLEKQKEVTMPNSTELIEIWNNEKAMLKEKDFQDDAWRLAQNSFMDGFARGIYVKTKSREQKPAENIPLSREEILDQLLQNGSITIFDYLYLIDKRKPAEWSEEDEKQIRQIEQIVKNWASPKLQEKIHNFLSSLRPQSKQEWSEEDGAKLGALINYFEGDALDYSTDDIVDWLKSLRPQPKQEWSKEDECKIKWFLNLVISQDTLSNEWKDECVDWLKSLRSQSKYEWSEEDVYIINILENIVARYRPDEIFKIGNKQDVSAYKICSWLGFLRFQSRWKPSKEQLDALKEASASWMNQEMGNCELLESLYNDLKKLI